MVLSNTALLENIAIQRPSFEAYLGFHNEAIAGQQEISKIRALARQINPSSTLDSVSLDVEAIGNTIAAQWNFSEKVPQVHTTRYNLAHQKDKSFPTGDCILPASIFWEKVKKFCNLAIYCLPNDHHPYLIVKNPNAELYEVHYPPHPLSDTKPPVAMVNKRSQMYVEDTFEPHMRKFPDLLSFLRYSDARKLQRIINADVQIDPLQKTTMLTKLEKYFSA